jgi:ABC-type uncharacterized transport system auxiliary subunit
MTRVPGHLALAGFLIVSTGGCALLTKADPLTPRYFSAEPSRMSGADSVSARAVASRGSVPELRLGRVTSASYLRERLVFRSSSYELGFYDDLRWTEKPETYLRRALSRTLFEEGAFRRVVSGAGPTLDVELVELSEMKAPAHVARARAAFVLFDPRSVRTEATVTVEIPIAATKGNEDAAAVAGALSAALSGAVERIVELVRAEMAATRGEGLAGEPRAVEALDAQGLVDRD